jgi:hypothetical protein
MNAAFVVSPQGSSCIKTADHRGVAAWRAGGMIRDRWRFEKSQARIASRDRERRPGSPVVHLHR